MTASTLLSFFFPVHKKIKSPRSKEVGKSSRRHNHHMRSSLETKRLKMDMANAEAALVQRGKCSSQSLWCRERQTPRSHSTLCHETRPGSHMLQGWLPNEQPLGLQKQRPRSPGAAAPATSGREERERLMLPPVPFSPEQEVGQAAASITGPTSPSGAGLLCLVLGCRCTPGIDALGPH